MHRALSGDGINSEELAICSEATPTGLKWPVDIVCCFSTEFCLVLWMRPSWEVERGNNISIFGSRRLLPLVRVVVSHDGWVSHASIIVSLQGRSFDAIDDLLRGGTTWWSQTTRLCHLRVLLISNFNSSGRGAVCGFPRHPSEKSGRQNWPLPLTSRARFRERLLDRGSDGSSSFMKMVREGSYQPLHSAFCILYAKATPEIRNPLVFKVGRLDLLDG